MGDVEALREGLGVARGSGVEILSGDRHRLDAALGADREALDQVGEVALVIARRGDPLIHLEYLRLVPVAEQVLEPGEHRPGVASAAERQLGPASFGDGPLGRLGEQLGAALVNRLGRVEHLEPVWAAHFGFSLCPPNWYRIAERTRSAKSSRLREAKRSYRAVVRTPAGTPSSIAAIEVQR